MVNSKVAANAMAVVMGVGYVVCRVLSWLVPGWLFTIVQSWFHTFTIESMKTTVSFNIGAFIFGGVSLVVVTWGTVYVFAEVYNKLAKK